MRLRRLRVRSERGAAMVEFALLVPLLTVLLFGIIEFALVFNDYQSLRQGVREGARQGVVADLGTDTSCGITGSASSANDATRRLICTTKERVGLDDTTRVKIVLGTAGYAKDGQLVVCAQRGQQSHTGLFSSLLDHRQIKSRVEMRIEKLSANPIQATEETVPSGGSWTWCGA